VPDAKTMGRWGVALGPAVIERVHGRLVAIAREQQVVEGRKMRLDTTVVETNIHYPTDSSLLGDGVRVLTRAMKTVTAIAGTVGARLRDRSRSVKHRVLEIGRIARSKGAQRQDKLTRAYQQLLSATSRVVGQAKRFAREIGAGVKRTGDVKQQAALEGLRQELDTFVPRVQQVMRQARARIFGGDTHVEDKLLSLFEPSTEVVRKGKASKPNEFGKVVKLQEAEQSSRACPASWRGTPRSTRAPMKRPRTRRASRASAFRTDPPRARSAGANRKHAGSATVRSGGPGVRAASVSSSGGMASIAVATKGPTA
jgi:IS5 family transposase